MAIVVHEALVLPILAYSRPRWLEFSTARRQKARQEAARLGLPASLINVREEHAMLPPWIANPVGVLVLGLDDGPSRPSFCGDIYVKRKLLPKGAPERHYGRGLAGEHMLHWTETGRFDKAEDVVEDCDARLRQHHRHKALRHAVVWRSPLLEVIGNGDVVRSFRSGQDSGQS